jgi:hypothetical protein
METPFSLPFKVLSIFFSLPVKDLRMSKKKIQDITPILYEEGLQHLHIHLLYVESLKTITKCRQKILQIVILYMYV